MSANFKGQPTSASLAAPPGGGPVRPRVNVSGSYTASANRQYYAGAVNFSAGATMTDAPPAYDPDPDFDRAFPYGYNGVFFSSPDYRCGVMSIWIKYSPNQTPTALWVRFGQNGNNEMGTYFGSDLLRSIMGCVNIELVPLPQNAVEFAPGGS